MSGLIFYLVSSVGKGRIVYPDCSTCPAGKNAACPSPRGWAAFAFSTDPPSLIVWCCRRSRARDFLAPCDCHSLTLAATASDDCLAQPEPSKQLLFSLDLARLSFMEQFKKQYAKQDQVVRGVEEEKNSRGFFGKLRHGSNDQAVLDEAISLLGKEAERYGQVVDYRDRFTDPIRHLENELDELNIQRRNAEGLKQSMDFLDSLGISTTADDAMAARIRQQAAAGNDYDNAPGNWLDDAPENEGPEL